MSKILALSLPIFHMQPFKSWISPYISKESIVFIVNYSNEPVGLLTRLGRKTDWQQSELLINQLIENICALSIDKANIFLSNFYDTKKDFLCCFTRADVVIFVGGCTENLVDKLEELNVTKDICECNKLIIAYSAGVDALLEEIILPPSEFYNSECDYYKTLSFRRGVGLIKGLHLTYHYDKNNITRHSILEKAYEVINQPIFGLANDSGIMIEDDKITKQHNVLRVC